jgi:hypothetical protein
MSKSVFAVALVLSMTCLIPRAISSEVKYLRRELFPKLEIVDYYPNVAIYTDDDGRVEIDVQWPPLRAAGKNGKLNAVRFLRREWTRDNDIVVIVTASEHLPYPALLEALQYLRDKASVRFFDVMFGDNAMLVEVATSKDEVDGGGAAKSGSGG